MIGSKDELKYYISADLRSRFGDDYRMPITSRFLALLIPKPWKFQVLLRKAEYYCGKDNVFIRRTIGSYWKFRSERYGAKCGFSVPQNVFGPGLCLGHLGTIVVNGHAKFGSNARIQAGVNIGAFSKFDENWTENSAPSFGDNIYIGPGAKVFGLISIGDNVAIGANAIVSKSVPAFCTVVGVNKTINNKGSVDMLRYGDKRMAPEGSYALKNSSR